MSLRNGWNNEDGDQTPLSPDRWLKRKYGIGKDDLKVRVSDSSRRTSINSVWLYLCCAIALFSIGYLFANTQTTSCPTATTDLKPAAESSKVN
ncbi:MAG: hypothetical protein C4288_22180 [Leptolyngbya sp. ERB_1_1]